MTAGRFVVVMRLSPSAAMSLVIALGLSSLSQASPSDPPSPPAAAPGAETARKALVPLLQTRARLEKTIGEAIDELRASHWRAAAGKAHSVVVEQPDNEKAKDIERTASLAAKNV